MDKLIKATKKKIVTYINPNATLEYVNAGWKVAGYKPPTKKKKPVAKK